MDRRHLFACACDPETQYKRNAARFSSQYNAQARGKENIQQQHGTQQKRKKNETCEMQIRTSNKRPREDRALPLVIRNTRRSKKLIKSFKNQDSNFSVSNVVRQYPPWHWITQELLSRAM